MSATGVAAYLAGAAGYGLLAAAGLLLLGRALGLRATRARALFLLATLFVVFLALSPFPDPATLDCAGGGTAPRLRPFGFLEAFARLWAAGAPAAAWARDLTVTSTVMNVAFFALVGAALAPLTARPAAAALFAAALSGGIEVAQLTALFGLYPCPYRHFDVDDLILNVAGILAGFALARRFRRRRARR